MNELDNVSDTSHDGETDGDGAADTEVLCGVEKQRRREGGMWRVSS